MLKQAYIMGMTKAFTDAGLLPRVPFQKVAEGADIAANATPQEVQTVGSAIGPQDLESMMKILEVLSMLFDQYQQQQGGMPPPPPGGMPPPPPPPPPGGMPPPPPPPGGMPPPPGGMPPPPGM